MARRKRVFKRKRDDWLKRLRHGEAIRRGITRFIEEQVKGKRSHRKVKR